MPIPAQVFSQCPGIRVLQTFTVREEEFEGRPHLVAPVVAIVEGVHNEAFYSAIELARNPEAWNDMPIPAFHPQEDGVHVSARTPALIDTRRIGRFFNGFFDPDGGKLKGEIWIDIEKAEKISPETLVYLRTGRPLEVSTALFSDPNSVGGEWHGERYIETVRNIRPDHLALLPGGIGACSWADGCGVRANIKKANLRELSKENLERLQKGGTGVKFEEMVLNTAEAELDKAVIKLAQEHLPGIKEKVEAAEYEGNEGRLKTLFSWIRQKFSFKAAEMSHEDTRHKLQGLIDLLDNQGWVHYIREVWDGSFVYAAQGSGNPTESEGRVGGEEKFYQRGYSVGEDGAVSLKDDAVEVERKYVPVTANEEQNTGEENETVDKKEKVAVLIGNGSGFKEEDREWLEKLTEERLEKFPTGKPPETVCLKINECSHKDGACEGAADKARTQETQTTDEPVTADQYIEKAPGAIQSVLRNAVDRENRIKAEAVKGLMGNKLCKFTETELNAKDLGELEILATMARIEVDFTGQSGARPENPMTNEDDKGPPEMPETFPVKKEG